MNVPDQPLDNAPVEARHSILRAQIGELIDKFIRYKDLSWLGDLDQLLANFERDVVKGSSLELNYIRVQAEVELKETVAAARWNADDFCKQRDDLRGRLASVEAELAKARHELSATQKAGGFCTRHRPNGGTRNCVICSLERQHHAISRIACICEGEPEVTAYDCNCDEDAVVGQVSTLRAQLDEARKENESHKCLIDDVTFALTGLSETAKSRQGKRALMIRDELTRAKALLEETHRDWDAHSSQIPGTVSALRYLEQAELSKKLAGALGSLVDAVNVEMPGGMNIGGKTGPALIQSVNALALVGRGGLLGPAQGDKEPGDAP